MDKTIFELIASKEIPSFMIWEDEEHCAFLDIMPLSIGHTLVVPKKNIGDYIFDFEDSQYQKLMTATKKVAKLLKSKIPSDRILMIVEGFEVPHVHVKLIPVSSGFMLNEVKPQKATNEELERVYKMIVE